jgi:hypothetical protein
LPVVAEEIPTITTIVRVATNDATVFHPNDQVTSRAKEALFYMSDAAKDPAERSTYVSNPDETPKRIVHIVDLHIPRPFRGCRQPRRGPRREYSTPFAARL